MDFKTLKDTSTDKLEDIITELQNYDIFDFLSKVSALNLLPHNQNKCIVLDTIINAILECKEESFSGTSKISLKKFKDIISKAMNLPIALGIDPAEMPFIYRVQFYGNNWIFSGVNTYFGFILQNFIDILFKYENNFDSEYIAKCRNMATFILDISTKIATHLGYEIDTLGRYQKKEVVFTDSKEFEKLINSITINISDIPNNLTIEDIEGLFAKFEATSIPSSTRNINIPAVPDTASVNPVPIKLSIVLTNEKSDANIAPESSPTNSEEKTSLVISASPMAIIGGSNAQKEPVTTPSPPQVGQEPSSQLPQATFPKPSHSVHSAPMQSLQSTSIVPLQVMQVPSLQSGQSTVL